MVRDTSSVGVVISFLWHYVSNETKNIGTMPYCAIFNCKNDSRTKNVSYGGVSYHRFPKNPFTKEKWIDATGRQNWMPSKTSTICSEHFDENNVQLSKRGYRYLNDNAIPIYKILNFQDQNYSEKSEPGPSKQRLQETPPLLSFISVKSTKKARNDKDSELNSSPTSSYPRKTKLIKMLQWTQSKIRKQNLKIKLLQTQNRRLNRKIKFMEELLTSLEDKFAMRSEDLISLENTQISN